MTMQSPLSPDSPAEQEASPLRRRTIILWLVAIGTASLLIPLYLIFATIRSDTSRLESRVTALRQTLEAPAQPDPETEELLNELADTEESLKELDGAVSDLEDQAVDWPAVMEAIGNYNPAQMTLSSVETGNSITLRGLAIADTVVVDYSQDLEETGLFSRVVVQSLRAVATPFATPTAGTGEPTPTSTPSVTPTATMTVTPVFEDPYEVDDFSPVPIVLGIAQERAFNPLFDVDRVKFLVKAGRYYRVSTADLWPGVDTYLTVDVGGTRYTNDDREPGDFASELVIQGGQVDIEAFARVSNRGLYGPDRRYELLVEEFIPTPRPTATVVPTPTETEIAPTGTPDPRDQYEPDDMVPAPIALGQTQLHNFYPTGDVDNISFLAKAGRWYRVATSDLAQGVDTHLAVIVGEDVYTNDDREPGDLTSEIVFQAGAEDAEAVVKITNRGQYGETMYYRVTVEEILPTPTPSRTPTPTNTPVPDSSPTPDLRDQYEPDDFVPSPIALGETQTHSFYPKGDVDQIDFLAKRNRWYRVATSDLADRVDTALLVTTELGETQYYTYTNDDVGPGNLNSEVVFLVKAGHDVTARVQITNRGQYGPDQTYDVTVEEVFPDLMAVGATQERTFELGREDRVQFVPKAGVEYAITTSGLALGVDTYLRVRIDGVDVAENDDYLAGSLASRVEFEAPSSSRALVLITNLQEQYGPDKTYDITIEEIVSSRGPSMRVPGLAAPMRLDPILMPAGRVSRDTLPRGVRWARRENPLPRPNAQAVEFVIVLELAR